MCTLGWRSVYRLDSEESQQEGRSRYSSFHRVIDNDNFVSLGSSGNGSNERGLPVARWGPRKGTRLAATMPGGIAVFCPIELNVKHGLTSIWGRERLSDRSDLSIGSGPPRSLELSCLSSRGLSGRTSAIEKELASSRIPLCLAGRSTVRSSPSIDWVISFSSWGWSVQSDPETLWFFGGLLCKGCSMYCLSWQVTLLFVCFDYGRDETNDSNSIYKILQNIYMFLKFLVRRRNTKFPPSFSILSKDHRVR